MPRTRIATTALALASALSLLLAGPLTAAPACSRAKIPVKAAATQAGQSIRSQAELSTALQNARGEETSVLGPGHYGKLVLRSNYKSPVTIRSASPGKPACFTGLSLKGAYIVIYNAHVHGISIHGTDNILIRKNTLVHVPGGHSAPAINISPDSTSVVIEQNATPSIIGHKNQRDWVVLNNAMIQDKSPSIKGHYDRQFIYHALGQRHGYNEYGVRPGSLIDRLNAGSTLVKKYPTR